MVGKFYVLLFAMAISSFSVLAQCHNITLSTQADVDAYPSRYGCSALTGTLHIMGYPSGDITNLDSLYMIESVGSLNIQANVWLTDLTGLSNVKSVANNLNVSDNSRLFSLEGLHNIPSAYVVSITGSEVFDLTGLRGLKEVRGRIYLVDLRRITSLDGLQNLTKIHAFEISRNPLLNDLTALRGHRTIRWLFIIQNNPALTTLAGLEDVVVAPDGYLGVSRNPALTTLDGLQNITTIGEIGVMENPQLTNLSALGSLTNIDVLWIEKNHAATEIADFPNLRNIGALKLMENTSLNTLEGFNYLTTASFIQLSGSPGIADLTGFRNLTTVDSALWIGHNPGLTDLSGLDKLDSIGYMTVYGNDNLRSLHGLESLKHVNGSYYVSTIRWGISLYQNSKLADLTALNGVTSINGDLSIQYSDSLKNLHGLEGLTSVNGMIFVADNQSLETLGALSNITHLGFDTHGSGDGTSESFHVSGNPLLKDLGIRNVHSMPAALRIDNNDALENLDDLESLESVGPNPVTQADVRITGNETLDSFCGLYTLLSEAPENLPVTISGNGVDKTPEQIVAEGPCDGEPQPGELAFTNITDTTMTVSFTPVSPAPSGGYLLLLRANNSPYPEDVPVDGNVYNVGQVLGSATIVVGKETGTGNSFNIVYLAPSTTYHYALFTFDSGLNYNTTSPILDSQQTLEEGGGGDPQDPIAQPTNLVFSDVTDNSMTVSFTASSSAGVDGYLTVMRAYGSSYPEDVPVDGTAYNVGNVIGSSSIVVGKGTSTTLNIIYLNPDTEYWFDVYSYTNDGTYDYVTTNPLEGMQRTSTAMVAAAYPNPFVESVTIRFTVKEQKAHVRVTIFDSMGSPVAELLNGEVGQGMHEVSWGGIDRSGRKASGLYHYTIMGHDSPVRGTVVAK